MNKNLPKTTKTSAVVKKFLGYAIAPKNLFVHLTLLM
jgi:hypothetical protein